MKLKTLIKGLEGLTCKGAKEIEISGITANSKTVSPGNLFVAKRGAAFDGNQFIREAVDSGAVAILSDLYDPFLKDVCQLVCPQVVDAEAFLSNAYFQKPSEELCMVGVTGTSGKTTTSYAIYHILSQMGAKPGLLGTIEYIAGANHYEASRTTLDVTSNQRILREMRNSGLLSCVMEVTSHALKQKRVANIEYDIAIFTNLTHEHLDYHKTMEDYFQSKKLLFSNLKSVRGSKKNKVCKTAIVNSDSPWSASLVDNCGADIVTYGIDTSAALMASKIAYTESGTHFDVSFEGEKQSFFWPLVGRFNVYNGLAAIGTALTLDLSLERVAKMLSSFRSARGRLERVDNALDLNIYVDYAHKEDALRNVLSSLRECTKGKIITVFGCGGDRDPEKRPKMGRAAEEFSDRVIVTSDNPRSEEPKAIVDAILAGFLKPQDHIVELDRKRAIEQAIDCAKKEDIVLIAGKGHETKQQFHHMIIDFDDRLVAQEYCMKKGAIT